jgi:hypothetical protein
MEIRRVDRNTFDVFLGTQWDQHIRVRAGRSSLYRVSGLRVDRGVFNEIESLIHPNMPINYTQPQTQTLANCRAI